MTRARAMWGLTFAKTRAMVLTAEDHQRVRASALENTLATVPTAGLAVASTRNAQNRGANARETKAIGSPTTQRL